MATADMAGHHRLCATEGLLRGLTKQHQGAVPLAPEPGKRADCTDERSDVNVVSRGVHDANLLSGHIFRLDVAPVGRTDEQSRFWSDVELRPGYTDWMFLNAQLEVGVKLETLGGPSTPFASMFRVHAPCFSEQVEGRDRNATAEIDLVHRRLAAAELPHGEGKEAHEDDSEPVEIDTVVEGTGNAFADPSPTTLHEEVFGLHGRGSPDAGEGVDH